MNFINKKQAVDLTVIWFDSKADESQLSFTWEALRLSFLLAQTTDIAWSLVLRGGVNTSGHAGVAQLVEHFLAKEDVTSSSLVTRSTGYDK